MDPQVLVGGAGIPGACSS